MPNFTQICQKNLRRLKGAREIFTQHNTTDVFFKKHSFCENIPHQPYRSFLLRWLTLRGKGD